VVCGVQYTMSPSPTTVSGSTRSTRRPLATRGSASSLARLRRGHASGPAEGHRQGDWVEWGACETAWQVPHYAESIG
jgi:hypothetical protein